MENVLTVEREYIYTRLSICLVFSYVSFFTRGKHSPVYMDFFYAVSVSTVSLYAFLSLSFP